MMWGKEKRPSSSCSRPSLMSWLAKFKQMRLKPTRKAHAREVKENWNPVYARSRSPLRSGGEWRFYGGEGDDEFWRLSFGDRETAGAPGSKAGFEPVLGGLMNEPEQYKDVMKVDVKRLKGLSGNEAQVLPEMENCARRKVGEARTPRRRAARERKLRRRNRRVVQEREHTEEAAEQCAEAEKARGLERTSGVIEREDCKLTALGSRDCSSREFGDDFMFSAEKEEESDELAAGNSSLLNWQKLKETRSEEAKLRKSVYIGRELQKKNSKVRACSPRTVSRVEICRIKAIEDMKRAKKKVRRKRVEEFPGLDSFAVVKCSFDPQQDFRDSMIEMIQEKKISKAEELEELLACYLTLNSDEYHDLIIKVFRQVWFDLNPDCFDAELDES